MPTIPTGWWLVIATSRSGERLVLHQSPTQDEAERVRLTLKLFLSGPLALLLGQMAVVPEKANVPDREM